ncbi:MAG TPA: hypothetical protein VJP87_07970, partial [Candidatus Acidoferrales bacterium]|nr:hypothetical protein [Candidatus Acidoferrales bacterium]
AAPSFRNFDSLDANDAFAIKHTSRHDKPTKRLTCPVRLERPVPAISDERSACSAATPRISR